jgi:transcription elongation factor Elf1
MLNFQWYTSLPQLHWTDEYGQPKSMHYGLVGIFVCAFIGVFVIEVVERKIRFNVCSKCGLSRAVTKTTILLTNEQKEDLYKKSPALFSEIHLNLKMALSSRVTANYVRCKKCGYQHECKLRTDAHVPDDYREVDSGFIR